MESNGARAASNGSGLEPSLVSGYKFRKSNEKATKFRLRKLPVHVKQEANGTAASSSSVSPVVPQFDEETMANFPAGRQAPLDMLTCKHCKKNILRRTAKEHVAGSKKRKAGDDDDDGGGGGKDSKKKKSKKEEQKPKQAKTKGPVDVEKQCGVLLANGAQCARSLTCKSHSMGAKRAVPGRSLPYDMLLQAYQKKNQARQQKAAIDASAAVPDEDLDAALAGPVDSDEERDAVMSSVARSLARPQPLVQHTIFPTRRKYQLVRMKEMLSNALSGNRSGNLFAVPPENRAPTTAATTDGTFAIPHPPSASPALTGGGITQLGGLKTAVRKASIDAT
ncbi:hypothetical protein DV737_g5731, partial [Chaetothyriales sp. CBS 132003]